MALENSAITIRMKDYYDRSIEPRGVNLLSKGTRGQSMQSD